jgi:hypothetical protein
MQIPIRYLQFVSFSDQKFQVLDIGTKLQLSQARAKLEIVQVSCQIPLPQYTVGIFFSQVQYLTIDSRQRLNGFCS